MKRSLASLLAAILVLSFPWIAHAAGKPSPPSKLSGSFDKFNDVEERFEEREWDDASSITTKIVWDFKEMLPELKKTVSLKTVEDFSFILNALREALDHKNTDNSLKFLVNLEKLFLEIMDNYDYKVPPVFKVIEWGLERAAEGCGRNDFPEVLREMDKLEMVFPLTQSRLSQKNAPQATIDAFLQGIKDVDESAKAASGEKVKSGLKLLREQNKNFISLF